MVNYSPTLDRVFSALADQTRRRIVERLAHGELTVGEIASTFSISQPAISKHVKVLEESGLLRRRVAGRVHHCRLNTKAMQHAVNWIDAQQRFWNASLDSLEVYLARPSTRKAKR